MLGTYSLLLALALGTMGLPHVLVRFYTNPDGRGARRTTVLVLGMLGAFGQPFAVPAQQVPVHPQHVAAAQAQMQAQAQAAQQYQGMPYGAYHR